MLDPTPTQVNARGLLQKIHPPQEVLEARVGAEGAHTNSDIGTENDSWGSGQMRGRILRCPSSAMGKLEFGE